jgi:hypothetical protein
LQYDVVGFQTEGDSGNFVRYLIAENEDSRREMQVFETSGHQISFTSNGRQTRVGRFAVGIEPREFQVLARRNVRSALVRDLVISLGGRTLIIGVDRLDHSKGLVQRLEAFEIFLDRNPEWHGKVTYLQITPKNRSEFREYLELAEVGEDFQRSLSRYELEWLADERSFGVWSGQLTVESQLNTEVTTAFPVDEAVGNLSPGVYVMSAEAAGTKSEDCSSLATQWFIVSDLGVTAFSGNDGIHVFVNSLATDAEAQADIRLIARNNEVMATRRTDAAGHAPQPVRVIC